MCKIDFLGTGLCPAVRDNPFVSYYPQGRMDICQALAEERLVMTERMVDIAGTCTLYGICDKQCYFISQLRPLVVARQLKEYVADYLAQGRPVQKTAGDEILDRLQKIVGERFASNDPAILVSYAKDLSPISPLCLPRYVAMPLTRDEIVAIMVQCKKIARNALEILFDNFLEIYWPHIFDSREFCHDRADAILSGGSVWCPPFDYPAFYRAMTYAHEVEWGKKLYPF
jgi:hypothetical protein